MCYENFDFDFQFLLGAYASHPNRSLFEEEVLRSKIIEAFGRKEALATKLGLSGDLRYVLSLATSMPPSTLTGSNAWRYFVRGGGDYSFWTSPKGMDAPFLVSAQNLIDNKVVVDGKDRKFRKWLEQNGAEEKWAAWYIHKVRDHGYVDDFPFQHSWKVFADNLFEAANGARGGAPVVVSLNPIDQLLCSYNHAFTSCWRIGGEWESCPSTLLGPEAGVAYLTDKSSAQKSLVSAPKNGRMHLFFPELVSVVGGRLYTLTELQAREILKWLRERMEPDASKWKPLVVRLASPVYLDTHTCDPQTLGPPMLLFTAQEAVCYSCGGSHRRGRGFLCEACSPAPCYHCNIRTGTVIAHGKKFCQKCWDASKVRCGLCPVEIMPGHTGTYRDTAGNVVSICENCEETKTNLCWVCGDLCAYMDAVADANGHHHPMCASDIIECKGCSCLTFRDRLPDRSTNMCTDCFWDAYCMCVCGQAILKTEAIHTGDARILCLDCIKSAIRCPCGVVYRAKNDYYWRHIVVCPEFNASRIALPVPEDHPYAEAGRHPALVAVYAPNMEREWEEPDDE